MCCNLNRSITAYSCTPKKTYSNRTAAFTRLKNGWQTRTFCVSPNRRSLSRTGSDTGQRDRNGKGCATIPLHNLSPFLFAFILRDNANRNNDLHSAVFDGGRRTAPLSAPLYALCQSHYVALAAAAQPAKHNYVVLCNRGQYITLQAAFV